MKKIELVIFYLIHSLLLSAVYYYGIKTDSFADDVIRVVRNFELTSIKLALTGELADRPVLVFQLWLEKKLWGGDIFFYRLVNVFLHALMSTLLMAFIFDTIRNFKYGKEISIIFASIFAIHPLVSQTIYIAVQRGVILSSFFGILSYYFFIHAKKIREFKVLAFLILSVMSKPISTFLPLVFLLHDKIHFKKISKLTLVSFLTLLIPIGYYIVLKKNNQTNLYTSFGYFVTQMKVVFHYIKLFVVPYPLRYQFDIEYLVPGLNVHTFLAISVVILIIFLITKIQDSFFKLLISSLILAFLPESSFFPIDHLAFEHRAYFPLIFFIILLSYVVAKKEALFKVARIAYLPICFCFIFVIQLRNFQIRPITHFFYFTLKEGSSDHTFNLHSFARLYSYTFTDELQELLSSYKKKFSKEPEYLFFESFLKFKKDINIQSATEIINKFSSGKMFSPKSLSAVIYLLRTEILGSKLAVHEKFLLVELLLSRQMLMIHEEPILFYLHEYYLDISSKILKYNSIDIKIDPVTVLKIRAIRSHYYSIKSPHLKIEVEEMLKKNPDNPILQRLIQMNLE